MEKIGYSVYEVSEATTIPYKAILKLIRDGRLPAFRVGNRYVITAENVQRLLDSGNTTPKPRRASG